MKPKYSFFFNKEPIDFIRTFKKGSTGNIKSRSGYINDLSDVELGFDKNEIQLDLKRFNTSKKSLVLGSRTFKNVKFITDNYTLVFDKLFEFGWFNGISYDGYSHKFPKKSKAYFKFIIPLKKDFSFHFQIQNSVFASDYHKWSTGIFKLSFRNNNNFYVLHEKIKNNGKYERYFIIESDYKQSYEDFRDKVFSIRVALGYITGDFRGGQGFSFSYRNKKREKFTGFRYQSLRNDIKNFSQPINTNSYSWLSSRDKKIADKLSHEKKLRKLSESEFSRLCEICLENDNFLTTLILLTESSKASLLLRPIGYSVILEYLSSIVVSKSKKRNPITNKSDAKKFRKELLEVLSKYNTSDSFEDVITLKGRINHINQVTNSEKLTLPFKSLGIELLEEDIKVIKSRNDFLHGRIPNFLDKENRTLREKDSEMYYASLRLYTLINMLILKNIGYDNYVLNFPKIHERGTGFIINEDYYRKV